MTRTSTLDASRSEPTRWISPFSRKRSSSDCIDRLISPTSSRKIVPPFACSSQPGLVAVRVGEAAAHVAEQLGRQQRIGNAGAIDRHQRRTAPAALLVDELGDDFLSDAALAGNEDLRVRSARVFDLFTNHDGCAARTDELSWARHSSLAG